MSTQAERRFEVLQRRLQSRTQRDGTALPGFKQNVAAIRAELAQMQEQIEGAKNDG